MGMMVQVLELAQALGPQCHMDCPLTGPVLAAVLSHRGLLGPAQAPVQVLEPLVRKGLMGSVLEWAPQSVAAWLSL